MISDISKVLIGPHLIFCSPTTASISLYSVQKRENTDQKNSENRQFSRSARHQRAVTRLKYVRQLNKR